MHHYVVQQGDSPYSIARRFGVNVRQLIQANPHKPVVSVQNQQTWSALYPGERLLVPVQHRQSWQWFAPGHVNGAADHEARLLAHQEELRRIENGRRGYEHGDYPYGVAGAGLGDAATDALNALLQAGDPCASANAPLVCAAQAAMGVGMDGKWGAGTAARAQALVPGAPGPCSPRPSWWAPTGQTNCGAAAPVPIPSIPIPTIPSIPGLPGVLPLPPMPSPPPSAPPALQAMAGIDPCASASAPLVCAAQAALGVGMDGKWGADTAAKAQAVFPGAPGPCSPRPSWWAPTGQSNCGGAPPPAPRPLPLPRPVIPPPGGGGASPSAPVPAPGSPPMAPPVSPASVIVAPKNGSSTMAVAGVIGVVALAGVAAVVLTGSHKQIVTRYKARKAPAAAPTPAPTHRAPARPRGPARRGPSRRSKRR